MSEARMPEMAAYQRNIDKMNALLAENARLREALAYCRSVIGAWLRYGDDTSRHDDLAIDLASAESAARAALAEWRGA